MDHDFDQANAQYLAKTLEGLRPDASTGLRLHAGPTPLSVMSAMGRTATVDDQAESDLTHERWTPYQAISSPRTVAGPRS